VAAVLGLIPGVGAMYNGQFFKGLIHVVIFAVLVSISGQFHIFGLFVATWVLYQAFEAFHTAKAMRDGQPLPDPLGLNEVGNWLNLGGKQRLPGQPDATQGQPYSSQAAAGAGYQQTPAGQYQPPYQAPYQAPVGEYMDPGFPPIPPIPPIPPVPPLYWRRKEPIGAVALIALGLLFLLGQMDFFSGRLFEFTWPLALIALGVWLIIRRLGDSQGGFK
jgi:hypothetical protein